MADLFGIAFTHPSAIPGPPQKLMNKEILENLPVVNHVRGRAFMAIDKITTFPVILRRLC